MERIKNLSRYQKTILVLLLAMLLVFTVLYAVISARVGYAYKGAILVPQEIEGGTVYTGRVNGEDIRISCGADETVTFRYEQKTYGPYTAKKDPTAIPKEENMSPYMTGMELRQGEKILFRGGVLHTGEGQTVLFNEDGSLFNAVGITYSTGDGIERDENGNPVDRREPSAHELLEIMSGPELTSKGQWSLWFLGVFISAVTVVLVLFPDELFRWKLSLRISNAYEAEPSDLELTGRYVSWLVLLISALIVYIFGLTV